MPELEAASAKLIIACLMLGCAEKVLPVRGCAIRTAALPCVGLVGRKAIDVLRPVQLRALRASQLNALRQPLRELG
jgi:hypothetical protein